MTHLAVTTCSSAGWLAYGRAMVNTFTRHWPAEVALTVYAEGFEGDRNGQVNFVDLDQAAPWLGPWKAARSKAERGYRTGQYKYRDDAVKFSHKVAAIGAAAETADCDVLIWLDADTVTHSPVTVEWLAELFPADADMAWLDRERVYPECGFLMFRLPRCGPVIRRIVTAYQTGEIFKLQQWHDSYVIQTVCAAARATDGLKIASLSGDGRHSHHPLCNSRVAECCDHLKGSRKLRGRSKRDDLIKPRTEPYWQF